MRLALPALGALAAEPLYLLVDTAIVGHLGTPQLAALALAATVLSNLVALCIFLTYGTTARVTRLHGAGQRRGRRGARPAGVLARARRGGGRSRPSWRRWPAPLVHALGGDGHVADLAARYLRIASLGLPMALVALAGQGWLRGMSDLRTPLVIVVAANVANVVLELLFVYGFDWGLDGSAWGTVLAQLGMGAAFATVLLRALRAAPDLARIRSLVSIGAQLFVRTAALLGCFVLATAVCARIGAATVARPPDRLPALRLPRARARRDRHRRPGHRRAGARRRRRRRGLRRRAADARAVAARRGWSSAASSSPSPTSSRALFTSDPAVIDQAHDAVAAVLR